VFLGRELQSRREVSERTSQIVDSEVKRIISESFERAKRVLQDNMDLLHAVAAALLDRETLTRDDVEILARGEKLPPRAPPPSTPAKPLAPSAQPKTEPKRNPPLLGGPEPSPA
jgi:cell division protease FtsH